MAKAARLLTLIGMLLVSGRGAWAADPAAQRQEAKRLRDQGVAAVRRGDFAAASEDFRQAYALYPSPNLLYNLGVALDRLGRGAAALDAFETFLDGAPSADPAAREFAAKRIAALEPMVARLQLDVAPAGAVVSVDEQEVTLPRPRDLPVAAGERIITVTRPGFIARSERIAVAAGEHRRVEITLQAEAAATCRRLPSRRRRSRSAAPWTRCRDGCAPRRWRWAAWAWRRWLSVARLSGLRCRQIRW